MSFNYQTLHVRLPRHVFQSPFWRWDDVKSIHDYVECRAALMNRLRLEELRRELPPARQTYSFTNANNGSLTFTF